MDEWHGSRLESHLCGKTVGFGIQIDVKREIEKNGEGFEYLHVAMEAKSKNVTRVQ